MRVFLLLAASALSLVAQPLSQGDRDFALSQFWASRKQFLDAVAGLSVEQWNFKPAPERWSIGECAEHIAVSEDMIPAMARQALANPATPEKRFPTAEARARDEKFVAAVTDRSHKAQAPEPLQPSRRFATPAEAIEHFKKSRAANINYITSTSDDLRSRFTSSPQTGELDLYQWYLLTAAHTARHTAQLLEVKSATGYPKTIALDHHEREYALSHLHASRRLFLDSIANITPAQWNFKSAPDRWSIAECAEHIVLTEELISAGLRQTLQGTAQPAKRASGDAAYVKDQKLVAVVTDRSQKAQAPETIRPTGRFKSPDDVASAFKRVRDVNIDFIGSTDADLRAFFMPHPLLGMLDSYQFVLLMSAHTERHTLQIQEVKTASGYPK